MEFENSTGLEQTQSGEQENVVDSQESPAEESGAGQESVVGSREDGGDTGDADAGEGGEGIPSDPDGAGQGGAKRQTREENAAIRAARLRARQEAEAALRAMADEEVAGMGLTDPYTQKPIASMRELREYGDRLTAARWAQKAKDTGRSVEEIAEEEENRAFVSSLRQEQKRKKDAEAAAAAELDFARRDLAEFRRQHADVDAEKLIGNERFLKFCGSRMGKEPLSELYADFTELVGEAGAAAVAKAASKSARGTGGGTGGDAALTPAQKAALDEWNAANPEMEMDAKEFLGR